MSLWLEILGISWRVSPGLTICVFSIEIGFVGANVGVALALRSTVNALVARDVGHSVFAAALAALACVTVLLLNRLHGLIGLFLIVEKVGAELEQRLLRDIAGVERVEHLERSDYLDRITLLKTAPKRIVGAAWNAVRIVFTVVQLFIMLMLLGAVSPWLLALIVLAIAPLWTDQTGRRWETEAEVETAEHFRLQRQLFDVATNPASGKEIRVSRAGGVVARLQAEAMGRVIDGTQRARARAAWLRTVGWSVFVAGFTTCLYVVVQQASSGSASAGDVVLVVTLTITLQQTVETAVGQFSATLNAGLFIEPYLWVRTYLAEERSQRRGTCEPPDRLKVGISINAVSFAYPGTARPVLDDVTVLLPAGKIVAVVGEFGSGKSTLVKLLSRFYWPDAGSITVDGIDLSDMDIEMWRQRTTAAYQDFGRYPQMTFAEAVGLGDMSRISDPGAIACAIATADASDIVRHLPDRENTRLSPGYGGVDLSEGQWQKTALARAGMRSDALLLVLDEPTASLDAHSERAIFERYMARARKLGDRTGAVTLIVSHRLSTVAGADLVIVLDDGKIVETGTHDELLASGGRYAELYQIHVDAYRLGPQADSAIE